MGDEEVVRLKRALEHAMTGVTVLDESHTIVFTNAHTASMLIYPKEKLLGKHIQACFETTEYDTKFKPFLDSLNVGETQKREFNVVRSDKKIIPVLISATNIQKDDKSIGYALSCFELTEMRSREKQLEDRTNELEEINNAMLDREVRMSELKNRITELESELKKHHEK